MNSEKKATPNSGSDFLNCFFKKLVLKSTGTVLKKGVLENSKAWTFFGESFPILFTELLIQEIVKILRMFNPKFS